jgi:hypothetical protein
MTTAMTSIDSRLKSLGCPSSSVPKVEQGLPRFYLRRHPMRPWYAGSGGTLVGEYVPD